MKIEVEIADDVIADYVERAAIGYWASDAEWDHERFVLTFVDDYSGAPYAVNREDFRRGLEALVAAKYVKTFGELIDHEGDMYTGDLMIQFAVFGKETYE